MKFGKKRAQISAFIAVAILLLALGGLLIYSGQLGNTSSAKEVSSQQASLSQASSSVSVFVNSCLKKEADKAIDNRGYIVPFSEMGIKRDIEVGIPECTKGFEVFKQQGIKVAAGTPIATVSIWPSVVAISLIYPLTITEGKQRSTMSEFSYAYERGKSLQLSNGQVARTTTLTSQDKKAEFLLPAGITVTDYDGNPVDAYGVKEIDVEEMAFPENVASLRVYELDSGQFSIPVKITLAYPEDYENPEELYVAWYDEENSIWHGIPTTRDTNRKTLSAELEHATKVGAVICSSKEEPIKDIQSLVFEQTCGRTEGEPASGKDAAGKDVFGSNLKGSCADTITPGNLWFDSKEGLYLNLHFIDGYGNTEPFKYEKIASVEPHEPLKNQLSSPCVVKDWRGLDKSKNDITRCVARVSEAQSIKLGDKASDYRCVQVCEEMVRNKNAFGFGSLYKNLKLSGGDGLIDGSSCECVINEASDDLSCAYYSLADPPTPGYESGIAGGYGVLDFFIHPGGCVVDKDGKGTPDMAVYASDQDSMFNVVDNSGKPYKKAYEIADNALTEKVLYDKAIAAKHYVINPTEKIDKDNFAKFYREAGKDNIWLKPEGSALKAGWNSIYFKVDEIQSKGRSSTGEIGRARTGCAHLWVNAQVRGKGITQSGFLTPSGKEAQLKGGGCTDNSDCASGLYCSNSIRTPPAESICRTPPAKSGDKCADDQDCAPEYPFGSYCSQSEFKCMKKGVQGDACSEGSDCRDGLRCFESKCMAPGKAGDKCKSTSDCSFGHYCSAQTDKSICVKGGSEGEDCKSIPCALGLRCVRSECFTLPGHLQCYESKCRQPAKAGDKCSYDSDCGQSGASGGSLKCENKVCTPPKGAAAVKYDPDDWYKNSICEAYYKDPSIPQYILTRVLWDVQCD